MKSFKHFETTQFELLRLIASNKRIKCHRAIAKHQKFLEDAYRDYVRHRGNAWAITGYVKSPELADAMSSLFSSSATDLAYIREIRKSNMGKCCSMCGALRSAQVDHFLPQKYYPEFSIFLPNLFPICGCNQSKQHKTIGAAVGERFLHPSYDRHISRKAVFVLIRDHEETPTYEVKFKRPKGVKSSAAFDYHTKTLIDQEGLTTHVREGFERICRRPSNVLIKLLDANPTSKHQLAAFLRQAIVEECYRHRSSNNWDSVFLNALLERRTLNWLWKKMSVPGRAPNAPLIDIV